ncbi:MULTISPECIES: DUF881 domain-containing protein [Streptomyces]|uniref:Uncharacterized protein YlxW (UPF0749 family) n=1 Tax=Streptomyces nymphaeiformis TaxID=2663842 RepID=A0A7W7XFX9_9ACTN|nr:uncharacterized protein YlxW (UPF0749 family) [Streptomyces nymphaeiformis]
MSENPQNSEDPQKSEKPEQPERPERPEGETSATPSTPGTSEAGKSEAGKPEPRGEDVRVPEAPGVPEAPEAPVTAGPPAAAASPAAEPSGRRRLAAALWPPRVTRAQLVVALLLFVLGLGLAIQVSSTSENSALRGARQEDLVRILDELDDRTQRLEDEKTRLEKQQSELESSSDQAEEARKQTQEKERQLGILAGTVAAEGPGITLTVGDPTGAVESDMLLDAIQELRAAGAEAIQVNGVRVVADSYFTGSGDDMRIDGTKVAAPYVFKVIGKPEDLEPALNIPGGVVQTLEKEQATATVERSAKIVVDALRPAKRPDYAQSSSQ